MFLRCKEEPARNVEKREKKFSRRTGTGLELFSGRWTIFQVSDYVSWPQLRLITARAELVSFIGASMDGKVSSFRANRNRQTFDILVDIGGGEGGGTPRPDYPEPILSPLFRR